MNLANGRNSKAAPVKSNSAVAMNARKRLQAETVAEWDALFYAILPSTHPVAVPVNRAFNGLL